LHSTGIEGTKASHEDTKARKRATLKTSQEDTKKSGIIHMDIQDGQDKGTIRIRPFRKLLRVFPGCSCRGRFQTCPFPLFTWMNDEKKKDHGEKEPL